MQINNITFINQDITKLIHGELESSQENITKALSEPIDRELLIRWASANIEIVEKSKTLNNLFYSAREITESSDFDSDIINHQAFILSHIAFKLSGYIRNYFASSTPKANLDSLAFNIRQKNLYNSFSDDQIKLIKECYASGLINNEDVINIVHEIKNNNFLNIQNDDYQNYINNAKILIEIASLEGNIELKTILETHERQEERLLLQYAKKNEIECIQKEFLNPSLETITGYVTHGEWETLLEKFGKDENLSFILLAAYRLKKITLDDVSTAIILHRAYFNAGNKIQICKIDNDYIEKIAHTPEQRQAWQKILSETPENQKIAIVIDYSDFDKYTQGLFPNTFHNSPTPGVFRYNHQNKTKCGLVSFGLSSAYYKKEGIDLTPILHLTPNFSSLASRTAKNKSDVALLLPTEEIIVHGSTDKTIFSQMHDLLHTNARAKRNFINSKMMEFVFDILKGKKGLPSYKHKLASDVGLLHSKFKEVPNQDELVAFILNTILGELIDSGYEFEKRRDDFCFQDMLNRSLEIVIKNIILRTYDELPSHDCTDIAKSKVTERIQQYFPGILIAPPKQYNYVRV